MQFRRTFALTAAIAVLIALPLGAQWPMTEKLDLDAIYRIKEEGLQRSKVMEIESYLTDVYGPRLTGSPNIKEAADWTERKLGEWGLTDVHRERWPFGRGWQNQRFVAEAAILSAFSRSVGKVPLHGIHPVMITRFVNRDGTSVETITLPHGT